ncbi:MAG: hypothetical protein ABR535_03245, partial [Pyrinomonadaceae bacterium]
AVVVRSGDSASVSEMPALLRRDEDTIATARSPFETTAQNDVEPIFEELPLHEIVGEQEPDESFMMLDPETGEQETVALPANLNYNSHSISVPARANADADKPQIARAAAPTSNAAGRSLDKYILPVALLVFGILAGAIAGYVMRPAEPEPQPAPAAPVITEMKSTNTALTAFEESRRLVDADPARYIDANAGGPQDAEDYYLLGRAYLISGKYWDAKQQFNEARNRLETVEPQAAKTLAADIAMALAIIASPTATDAFTKTISVPVPNANASSTNTSSVIQPAN